MTQLSTLRIRGIPVGAGIAVGTARVISHALSAAVPRRAVPPELVEFEVERLRRSTRASRDAIASLRDNLLAAEGEGAASLLDPLVQMHHDPMLVERAVERIYEERVNAEFALSHAVEDACAALAGSASAYLKERADDVRHVARHLMRALRGERRVVGGQDAPYIVVADEISPAELALLARGPMLGLVMTSGSGTSHTALLARSIGVPAVVGARLLPIERVDGAALVVDGLRGEVLVSPTDEQRRTAEARSERFLAFTGQLEARRDLPVATTDGVEIELRANLDIALDASEITRHGISGVGLFRTEYLYLSRSSPPCEDEQTQIYERVVTGLAGRPCVLRTFDLGGDKVRGDGLAGALPAHPVMGHTGVRFSLMHPNELRAQLRAVLRASAKGPISVLFPRVTRVEELDAALTLLEQSRIELAERGVPFGDVRAGIMVEVPAAALIAERFAERCDFFAIGTNDLTQFTLAIDRSDAVLAEAADALHPAVLELVGRTVRAARRAGIECSICGDVASDPVALPLLLGLGCTTFSVPIDRVPFVAEAIRRSSVTDARLLVDRAFEASSSTEVRAMARERFAPRLADLWAEQGIDATNADDREAAAPPLG